MPKQNLLMLMDTFTTSVRVVTTTVGVFITYLGDSNTSVRVINTSLSACRHFVGVTSVNIIIMSLGVSTIQCGGQRKASSM